MSMSNGVTGGNFVTLADMQASKPRDGTVLYCEELGNAKFIKQESGYVALPGDVTLNNGGVLELQINDLPTIENMGGKKGEDVTQAIQAANSRGTGASFGDGVYLYGDVTIDAENSIWKSDAQAELRYISESGKGLIVDQVNGVIISGFVFSNAVERTSGGNIFINSATEMKVCDCTLLDVYNGIEVEGIARSEFTDIWFRRRDGRSTPSNRPISLKQNQSTGVEVVNLKMTRVDGVSSDGLGEFIYLECADWVSISNCHANLADYFLHIEHGASNIRDVWVENSYADFAEISNVLVDGAGGGIFDGLKFVDSYFRSATESGIVISGSGDIKSVQITSGCKFSDTDKSAISVTNENVDILTIDDCVFATGIGTSNTYPIIETWATRNIIDSNAFLGNSGLVDIKAERTSTSGQLLITGNGLSGTGSLAAVDVANFSAVKYSGNLGLADTAINLTGQNTVNTDGSGFATIPHTLGSTPSYADVQLRSPAATDVRVTSLSASDITVYLFNTSTGSALTGASRTVYFNLFL